MADATKTKKQSTLTQSNSLLEQAVAATKQTERSQAEELIRTLTENALEGQITWDKNLVVSVSNAIAAIDAKISEQLAKITHEESFKKLESSWAGLNHFVKATETSANLRIRMLQLSKNEMKKDFDRAVEFDQSQLFKKIYESEFGTPGGEPYGVLLGDYYWSNHPEDINTLRNMSCVAAAGFCPFISSSAASMFGFDSWTELASPRDLEKIFDTVEFAKWKSFRETDDSRFVSLTLPRALARLPYGRATKQVEEFDYEEFSDTAGGVNHDDYCWMNAAYLFGEKLTHAFATTGWCTAIRGAEGGGKVEDLPLHTFKTEDGDIDAKCPTEIGIADRREAELSKLGFLPLSHYKNTDYAVFFGGESTQKAKKYDTPEANDNAKITARIPYIMASSRFAHFLKVMARDKIGSFMQASEVESWLNRWINNYVNANASSNQALKTKYPLAEAQVQVKEIPGNPGAYNAVVHLKPWLQMEELTASIRMVARIPKVKE